MIIPMAQTGKDPVGAMGMDSPLAVLSEKPRLLYDYFQQNFAQVTNPPIDAIRESIVTSSTVYVGNMANIMDPDEKGTAALAMDRPLLTNEEMEAVKELQDDRLRPVVLSLLYTDGKGEMEKALHALFDKALEAVKSGHNILILSDRGVDKDHLALPALLASAGLHNFLIREKCGPMWALSWSPENPGKYTISAPSSDMAPPPSIPTWPWTRQRTWRKKENWDR